MRHIDIPPAWFFLCALCAWAIAAIWPIYRFNIHDWIIGVIVASGTYLIIWSAFWFWRKKTPIEPRNIPNVLLVNGPYKINRNPIYTGVMTILLGIALSIGAVSALLPVLAFPILITHRFIKDEERGLREKFGAEAEQYFAQTRRW